MEINEKINNKLIEGIKNNDEKKFDEGLIELKEFLKDIKFKEKIDYINNMTFNDQEKIMFYIKASRKSEDILPLDYTRELIPEAFDQYININEEEFYNTLKTNKELQEQYAQWFKEFPFINEEQIELYSKIFNLEVFKKIIFNDEELIGSNCYKYNFFSIIPNDYAYLIAFYDTTYDTRIEKTSEKIINLYKSKFKNKLKENEQLELVKTQILMNSEPNILDLTINDRMQEFKHCLKKIYENPEYFKILKEIMSKVKLDLKDTIKLASKYDDTELFKKLYDSNTKINEDTIDKIKYLAKENKVKDISTFEVIEKISIDELKRLEKCKNNKKATLYGGPQARTNNKFFTNGPIREIISINQEGNVKEEHILNGYVNGSFDGHLEGLLRMYKSIDFPKGTNSVVEKAAYATSKLSAITLVIEGESCFSTFPDKLTQKQLDSICNLLNKANEDAELAILVCDSNNNQEILFDGRGVSKKEAIDYLLETNKQKRSL